MKRKISEITSSHVSSRVLQTCVKHCTQDERNDVFRETQPHFVALASNTYAVHLITKLLDHAPKELLTEFISSLHGHVACLLRHMGGIGGSLVIEHAYHLGNATQKQTLLMELYSPELKLFKDLVTGKDKRNRRCNFKVAATEVVSLTSHDIRASTHPGERDIRPFHRTQH
ncbi:Pumilio 24 [Orobanche gracilis]